MKYLSLASLILFTVIILVSCDSNQSSDLATDTESKITRAVQADVMGATKSNSESADYDSVDKILADISVQMNQPNILKDDILRGWYMGQKEDKKYGTPDSWIFVEDGENSKWVSPNVLDEGDLIDDRQLCRATAGTYVASCLETSESECDYVDASYCDCLPGSKWKEAQGCILVTERGAYVSINNAELQQGSYLGLPNEKKLNTPPDWIWVEKGRASAWQRTSNQ